MTFAAVHLAGVTFDAVTEAQAVDVVRQALERGEGGWIFTPNVDILRQATSDVASGASLVVADGAPLVWASRLAGTPLPARVPGSDLVWSLARMAGAANRSLFLLGGAPSGHPGGPPGDDSGEPRSRRPGGSLTGARRAADVLRADCPGLRIAGTLSPPFRFDRDPVLVEDVREELVEAKPDVVYVGLGYPRQEQVIAMLRPHLPGAWFLGCGGAINFLAGDRRRAPVWMRRCGLEWLHRLGAEPRRLWRRYLRDDAPYALRLLLGAIRSRYR
ncbi:MAG: N-acetylglucosaminyldiphosphoundecaprenol N-acetyl-beta-D-mannosaminyltransferase [Micromonosporaceae bacterium]